MILIPILVPVILLLIFLAMQAYYCKKDMKVDNTPQYGKNRAEIDRLLELDKTEMEMYHKK